MEEFLHLSLVDKKILIQILEMPEWRKQQNKLNIESLKFEKAANLEICGIEACQVPASILVFLPF